MNNAHLKEGFSCNHSLSETAQMHQNTSRDLLNKKVKLFDCSPTGTEVFCSVNNPSKTFYSCQYIIIYSVPNVHLLKAGESVTHILAGWWVTEHN